MPEPATPKLTKAQVQAQDLFDRLNERQRAYLRVIFNADQDEEQHQKGAYLRGEERVSAEVWRWQEYEPTRRRRRGQTAKRGRLQQGLDELEVRDPGAGSTIQVLENLALIEVRYASDDPAKNRMAIKLTKLGRLVARVGGVDDTRSGRATARRPLSEGLWRMLGEVYAAGESGLTLRGYSRHPAWDSLAKRDMVTIEVVSYRDVVMMTDVGRAHYRDQWAGYSVTYPAVNAPHPDGSPAWPEKVDQELARLREACRSLAAQATTLAEQQKMAPPKPTVVDKAATPEQRRAGALRNQRVKAAVRSHDLVVQHQTELVELHRAAVARYLAVAAAVVQAVIDDADPCVVLTADPAPLGLTTELLPYPRTGVDGIDKDVTTARPGTSHRRGKRAPQLPAVPVTGAMAYQYAEFLADLAAGGTLSRLLQRHRALADAERAG